MMDVNCKNAGHFTLRSSSTAAVLISKINTSARPISQRKGTAAVLNKRISEKRRVWMFRRNTYVLRQSVQAVKLIYAAQL